VVLLAAGAAVEVFFAAAAAELGELDGGGPAAAEKDQKVRGFPSLSCSASSLCEVEAGSLLLRGERPKRPVGA